MTNDDRMLTYADDVILLVEYQDDISDRSIPVATSVETMLKEVNLEDGKTDNTSCLLDVAGIVSLRGDEVIPLADSQGSC